MHGNYSSKILNWCVPCLCINKHLYTKLTNQQMHISVCSVTYWYSSPHVSVNAVTIISAAYNNNTVNIQIIVQKCTIKPPGVTLDIVQ